MIDETPLESVKSNISVEFESPAQAKIIYDAIILEFKVYDEDDEENLKETVQSALAQIEEKQYAAQLIARGVPQERIRCYGFAFEGKKVLIG